MSIRNCCTRLWRGLCVAVLACLVASPVLADSEVFVLFDLDNNPATGCSVATADGQFDGAESVVLTTVSTTSPPTVTGVSRQICVGATMVGDASFVAAVPVAWPVGMDNGPGGADVVETYAKPGLVQPGQQVRIGFMSRVVGGAADDADALILASGQAIVVDIPEAMAIPALGTVGALVLSLALAGAFFVYRRRLAARGMTFVVLLVFAGWVLAVVQITRDGEVGDWASISPTWTDDSGDGPPNADILAIYMQYVAGRFDFRFDMDIQPDQAPTVTATTPAAGAIGVATDATVDIVFSEPVDVAGNWFQIDCPTSGLRTPANVAVSAGPTTYTLTPNLPFAAGETCTATVFHAQVTDQDSIDPPDSMAADHDFSFTIDAAPRVVSSLPAADAIGVARNANVVLTFSEPVHATGNWFQIACSNGTTTPANAAVTGDGSTTLTIDPSADFTESDHCVATVYAAQIADLDGAAPANMAADHGFAFDVVVVNNPPGFTKGADQTALEDAAAVTVAGWATAISPGPAHESGQTVSFQVTGNNNPGLFSAGPAVDAAGNLTFTPAANANGSASITLVARDSGGTADGGADTSAPQSFTITLTPVNDAPSFSKGADQSVLINAGAQTVANWATAITAGPADESGQTLGFIVGNDNGALFSVAPSVSTAGTLTYTPAPGVSGSAGVTVRLQDNGGTAAGGVDNSAVQSFTITVNQPPAITSAAGATFTAGAPGSFTFSANGYPAAFAYSVTGCTLPGGLGLGGTGNNTLSGTAQAGTGGALTCTLTAGNGVAPDATQSFTLTVEEAPDAVADSAYSTLHDTALPVAAPGLLGNDGLGYPAATIATAGGTACGAFPCTGLTTEGGSVEVAADGSFTYTPPTDFAGADSFSYSLANSVGSNATSVAIDVTDAAPVVDLNGAAPAGIDFGPVAFTEAAGAVAIVQTVTPDELTLSDSDSAQLASATIVIGNVQDGADETLGLTCPDSPPPACSGAIQTTDIVATPGAGTYTLTITRVAPLADYEALLRTLKYNNASANPTTTPDRDISVTINDRIVDNDPVAHATVTVAAVNTAPVLAAIESAALVYTANSPAAAITATLAVSDADSANLAGATVAITGNCASADDVLGFTNQAGISGTYVAATCTLSLTGDATPAAYQTALRSVTYANADAATSTALRSVTFRVDDGEAVNSASNTQVRSIDVKVNAAPAITAGGSLSYSENGAPAAIDSTITVTDSDSPDLVGATVQISANCDSATDVLTFVNQNGITGSAGSCSMTLSGTSSLANYQAALRSVAFSSSSDTPATLARTVTWQVDDGAAANNLSNTATSTVNVAAVNDAPVLTAGGTLAYTENGPATAIDTGVTVADVDSASLTGATVQITGNCHSPEDVLAFVDQNGITGSYTAGTCLLTLSGSATKANYQTALRSVTYSNASDNPNTADRTVTWVADDGQAVDHASAPVTGTVTVAAVNDAPVLAAVEGTALAYLENGAAPPVSATLTLSDIDSGNMAGATVQITGNCNAAQDVLGFVDQAGITGGYTPATCLMTLSGTASVASYQTALRAVTYSNASNDPDTATRTVTFQANDGGAGDNLSNSPTRDVTVTAVNDAPTATGHTNLPAQAGIPIAYPAATLGGTDVESGTTITINTTPDSVCTDCAVTINGDGSFTFTPPPSAAGTTVSFTYHVADNGSPAPGLNSAAATVSFSVTGPELYFVKSSGVGRGDCTLGNECTLATALSGIGARTNTRIFIGDNATHSNSVSLNSNGWLIGQGVTGTTFDDLFGIPAPAQGTLAARPSLGLAAPTIAVASAGTNVVNLTGAGTSNSVRGLALSTGSATTKGISGTSFGTLTATDLSISGSGPALDLATGSLASGSGFSTVSSSGGANGIKLASIGTTGTVSLGNGTLSGASLNTLDISGGAGSFSYGGTIASGSARSVSIAGKTGGAVALTGAITDNDTGILLSDNAGTTIDLTGQLTLNTGANTAFSVLKGGTVTASNAASTITTTTGTGFNVDGTGGGATGNVSYAGSVQTTGAGRTVNVTAKTGGTVAFTGNVANTGSTATGVSLTSNTGATIRFAGGLQLNTGVNAAFTASGGGTVEVCDENPCNPAATGAYVNTLTAGAGTALSVSSTSIGAGNLEFRSIASNGAVNGIVLSATGSTGALKVKGTGSAGSGGTIQNSTGDGILLASTTNPSFSYMNLTSNGGNGIKGSAVNGLSVLSSTISSNGNDAATDESGILLSELTGTSGGSNPTVISNTTISNNHEFQVQISNSAGTLGDLQITNSTISSNGASGVAGNLVNFLASSSAAMTLNVTGSSFTGNAPATATGVHADASGGTVTANVSTSTFTNNNAAVNVSAALGGSITYDVHDNATVTGNRSHGLNEFIAANTTGSAHGKFRDNVVGTLGVVNSGSETGYGIRVQNEAIATNPVLMTGNTVQELTSSAVNVNHGISAYTYASPQTTSVTATGNLLRNVTAGRAIVASQNFTVGSGGTTCTDISGNTMSGVAGQAGDGTDIRLKQFTGGTFNVRQLSAADLAAVNGLIVGDINLSGTPTFAGPACAQP